MPQMFCLTLPQLKQIFTTARPHKQMMFERLRPLAGCPGHYSLDGVFFKKNKFERLTLFQTFRLSFV